MHVCRVQCVSHKMVLLEDLKFGNRVGNSSLMHTIEFFFAISPVKFHLKFRDKLGEITSETRVFHQ